VKPIRVIRTAFAVLLAASSLAIAGAGNAPVASAATSCASGQHPDDITLQANVTEVKYREYYYSGGSLSYSTKYTILSSVPAGKVTVTFCVGKSGTAWAVLAYRQLIEYAYYNMDSSFHFGSAVHPGLALKLYKPEAKGLTVEPTMCVGGGGALELLKAVLNLPIPGVPYAISLAQAVGGALIPSGTAKCQAFDDESMPFSFTSAGYTSVATMSRTYQIKTPVNVFDCASISGSVQCFDVDEFRWKVTDAS
jgi:hypothetical protein